jgi:hypothetical protein
MKKTVTVFIALCWLLAGCVAGGLTEKPRGAPFMGGAMQVGVPDGYCIDKAASKDAENSAIVLIGKCSEKSGVKPALITVAIGPPGSGAAMDAGPEALAQYFTAPEGRAALSRDGKAEEIRVIEALSNGQNFFIHFEVAGSARSWRAFSSMLGRLLSVSVRQVEGADLPEGAARDLLDDTLNATRKLNPV